MTAFDIVVMVTYFFLILCALGYVKSAKKVREFSLGNQQFSAIITFATLAATCIGPGFAIGLTGRVGDEGFIWYVIFAFFSIQMIITGLYFAPKLRAIKGAYTLGDVLGQRFGLGAKIAAGIISTLFCMGIVGAIARVTGTLAENMLGINPGIAIFISVAVVILYSTIGGIKAIVMTDVIQFIVLALIVPLVVYFEFPILLTNSYEQNIIQSFNPGGMNNFVFIGIALSFLLGEFLLPPYAQRALITRHKSAAKGAFILVGIFSLVWFFVLSTIGAMGHVIYPHAIGDQLFIEIVKNSLPPGLTGLVIAALLSIIASSQDSFLNSASVACTEDVIRPFKKLTEETRLQFNKALNVVVGFGAALFALFVPSIVDALLIAYALWAPTMVAPLVAALLKKNISPYAGLSSMLAGGTTSAFWQWGLNEPFGIPSLVPGLLASICVILIIGVTGPVKGKGIFTPIVPQTE